MLVVAHRGSSHAVAEHTLAAYTQAIEEGADALECDVRLTRDGVLVCIHDRRVDRTAGDRGVVSTLELAQLDEMDFGAGRRRMFEDPLLTADWEVFAGERTKVLTFERLLEVVRDCGRPVQLHVETKHPTRYGSLVERELVRILTRFGLRHPADPATSPITVMSFAPVSLRRVHELAPLLPTVLLMERVPRWLRSGALPPGVPAAGPALAVLRAHPRYVERSQAVGHRVHVWTVDEPADVDYVRDLGVDALITNRPAQVLARLGR